MYYFLVGEEQASEYIKNPVLLDLYSSSVGVEEYGNLKLVKCIYCMLYGKKKVLWRQLNQGSEMRHQNHF